MKLGLALGSGSARGFSHIGIIDCLLDNGIIPSVVAGTSIGAIVGAAYAGRHLEKIEGLQIPFGTVTCDLMTGKEIWITKGSVFDSVWPSMAMPGVFPPVEGPDGRWFIDGGIVNPVPVSLCRALGADIVIAVNLNNDLLRRVDVMYEEKKTGEIAKLVAKAKKLLPKKNKEPIGPQPPDFFETISRSINIAQDRITKTRLAGDPPEVILCPKVADIGLLETYRAEESINAGYRCCEMNIEAIKDAVR